MKRSFFIALALAFSHPAARAESASGTFTNPVNPAADPWVGFEDGRYFLATTQGDSIRLWQTDSVADLAKARPQVIWGKGHDVWAPEFHKLRGPDGERWYCYFTMSDGPDINHRMYVLESRTARIDGPYGEPKLIRTDPKNEFYAIDGTVFVHPNGKRYFLWAGHPGHRLFISEMENPWTLKGERKLIEASGFGCQEVREGPFIITHGNRIFLTYSACDTGKPDYCLGALWTTPDQDPMLQKSWVQIEKPILKRADENGVYGPGHHSFFKSPDGKEDWIAYHGKKTVEYTYKGRSTRLQKLEWTAEGLPVPVVPLSLKSEVRVPSGDPRAAR